MEEIIGYLVMIAFSGALGFMIGFIYSIVAITIWLLQSTYIGLVKLSVILIEWADDHWYQLEIADHFYLRGLVTLPIGGGISIALLWLGYFFNGTWVISIVVVVIVLIAFLIGAVADPEQDWLMPHFPTLGKEGAKVALNI